MRLVGRPRALDGHPRRVDALVTVGVAAVAVLGTVAAAAGDRATDGIRPLDAAGVGLLVLGASALLARRTAPLTAFGAAFACALVYQAAGYPGGPGPLPVIVVLHELAHRGERQRALGLALLATLALVGVRGLAVPDGLASPLIVVFPTIAVAALYAGQIAAGRRSARQRVQREAEEAEREHERETLRRVDAERLRIARELHDVVAHNISMINVQATMGAHVITDRPQDAADALTTIKQASRQTLRELRTILDVLRDGDDEEPMAPTPGLPDLDALVRSSAHAGLDVRLEVVGAAFAVPPAVSTAAYRIVQESLTNVLRHGAAAPTRIVVQYAHERLTVSVEDQGPGASPSDDPGHGIAGMRERAEALGGGLHVESAPGGFAVRAELPVSGGAA